MKRNSKPSITPLAPPWRMLWPDTAERPVLGFAAWSGAGKTTLLTAVIPLLRERGTHLALVKHAHHKFDVDHPGKDSYRLREAGAEQVLLTSSRRRALMTELRTEQDPVLREELTRLDQSQCDLILVEGFRRERFPKLEIYRPSLGKPPLYPNDECIIAIVTDQPDAIDDPRPILNINDHAAIADFICDLLLPGPHQK